MSVSSPWEMCLRAVQAEGMQAWRAGCGVIGTAATVQSGWHTHCPKWSNRHRAMPNLPKVLLDVSQLH